MQPGASDTAHSVGMPAVAVWGGVSSYLGFLLTVLTVLTVVAWDGVSRVHACRADRGGVGWGHLGSVLRWPPTTCAVLPRACARYASNASDSPRRSLPTPNGGPLRCLLMDVNKRQVPPILTFALMVGLGLDYHVFLLNRVVEYRLLGHSDREAVLLGLANTGRVITAAGCVHATTAASNPNGWSGVGWGEACFRWPHHSCGTPRAWLSLSVCACLRDCVHACARVREGRRCVSVRTCDAGQVACQRNPRGLGARLPCKAWAATALGLDTTDQRYRLPTC